MLNKQKIVFLDFGAAYGNLGEEALLLNAIDRINQHLVDPLILLGARKGAQLPTLPSNVIVTDTPRKFFVWTGRLVRGAFVVTSKIPVLNRLVPQDRGALDSRIWKISHALIEMIPAKLLFRSTLKKPQFALSKIDFLYSVGAGAINDFNLIEITYKKWLAQAIHQNGGYTVLSSQGIGPLELDLSRQRTIELCSHMDLVTLRDHAYSMDLLTQLGVPTEKMHITGDEAFSLQADGQTKLGDYLAQYGLDANSNYFVFHYRESNCEGTTSATYQIMASALDSLVDSYNIPIVFVPMSYGEHSTIDMEAGLTIKGLMHHQDSLIVPDTLKDVRFAKAIIGSAACAIGLSYHVHIFALEQNRPSVMIYLGEYYRFKLEGLAGFYPDNATRVLDADGLQAEALVNAVTEVMHAKEGNHTQTEQTNKRIGQENNWHLQLMAKQSAT